MSNTPYARICEVFGVSTQMELAAALGVSQPTVSLALRNGSMPGRWLLTALRLKQVNPDWILSGEGPQYLVAREEFRP